MPTERQKKSVLTIINYFPLFYGKNIENIYISHLAEKVTQCCNIFLTSHSDTRIMFKEKKNTKTE